MCFGKKKKLRLSSTKSAVSPLEDRPRVGGARNSRRAQKSLGSANINTVRQAREDGSGMVDSSSGAVRTLENSDAASRDVEGGYGSSGSERGDGTNSGPPSQPKSSGDPSSNLLSRQSLKSTEATREIASDYRGLTRVHDLNNHQGEALGQTGTPRTPAREIHSHNGCRDGVVYCSRSSQTRHTVRTLADHRNTGHSQTSFDSAATEYAYQKRNLDNHGRPLTEGESATGSQNQSEDRNTFGHKEGYGMGGGCQITRDTSINASIQHQNTQGKFDGNSGSYNNYGDKDIKVGNKGVFVKGANVEMNFIRVDSEGPTRAEIAPKEEGLQVPWMVTYCRNKGFTGRDDILRKLKRQAQAGGHNRVALWGLGGTGKTQIALEYVYQCGERRPVFWVHGSSLERFSEEFRSIGTSQSAVYGMGNDALTSVKRWFESPPSGEWILVVDNADNERDFDSNSSPIAQYLPRGPKGTLIITTRSKQVASRLGCHGESIIEVPRMGAEEARQLFLFRYGALSHPGDEKAVEDMLGSLYHLPLAVVGAAAYMTETSTVPSEYLKMFKSEDDVREKLLSQEFNDICREGPTGVAESILSTFFITFEQIKKEYPQAADLLRLIAFMGDHQNISEEALRRSGLEGMNDTVTARNAIGKLVNFSLVTKTARSVGDLPVYELHRLVQISAEAYLKTCEGKDVSVWMARAREVEQFASQLRLPFAGSSWKPLEPLSPEIEQLGQGDTQIPMLGPSPASHVLTRRTI